MEQQNKYRVIVSARAAQMLVSHAAFLAQVSPAAAERLTVEFEKAAKSLEQMPQRCPWLKGEYIPKNAYRFILFEKRYIEVYNTCEDAASYLANLYSNHTDVFDIMELDYLRAINSSLFFINKLRNVNSSKLKDSDELTIKVWGEYSKQVNKLIDNLHDLIIKWNCDGLTNIKLK